MAAILDLPEVRVSRALVGRSLQIFDGAPLRMGAVHLTTDVSHDVLKLGHAEHLPLDGLRLLPTPAQELGG